MSELKLIDDRQEPDEDRLISRFLNKVEKTPTCWIWKGSLRNGYGLFRLNSKIHSAHRISFELFREKIPRGLSLDHICRNTKCVNPYHLDIVTHRENVLRGISPASIHARQTHCKNGHEFTNENTRIETTGSRQCRICDREYKRSWVKSHPRRKKCI